MNAVAPRSLVAQVHGALAERIAGGEVAPGEALNIAELAKAFGISPTPVREALARLAAQGLVAFTDNIGYSVAPMPTAVDYTDWAVARLVVESNALRFVLGPIDARLLDEAEAINERLGTEHFGEDAEGVRRYSEANWSFHARLIGLARNPLLDDIHAGLYRAPQFSRIFLGRGIPDRARVVAEHRRILTALRRGDRERAARALAAHIVDSLERDARLADAAVSLKRLLREAGPPSRARRT